MNSNRVDEKILGGEKTRNFLLGEKWPFLGNISKEWEEKGRVLVCENIYIYMKMGVPAALCVSMGEC